MLVLQLWGETAAGRKDYEAVFSGLSIALNKPYYVAASVTMQGEMTEASFYLKELAATDKPPQTAKAPIASWGMLRFSTA